MPETDIDQTVASDLTNATTNYSVDSETTDANAGEKEYRYQIEDWEEHLGFYKNIPELQVAIDAKANWTIGAGFEADEITSIFLDRIKGNGKDSFNSIIQNMIRTYTIGGDAFAEIMRDTNGFLINLKPLDPSTMVIISNSKGQIIRYEQVSKIKGKANKIFEKDEILHLSRKRIADEVHGISVIPSVKWIILARNEAMADWKKVLHRNVKPMRIWYLDTDDETQIASFKNKTDAANEDTENLYVPKGTVETEIATVAPNQTLNPLTWIDSLNDYFFQAVNVPQIIIGNAKEFTDASGKIVYLSYEQSVKGEQLYIEEQILNQLYLEIQLTFPASLENDVISSNNMELEEEPMEPAAQPNDTMSEMEGKT